MRVCVTCHYKRPPCLKGYLNPCVSRARCIYHENIISLIMCYVQSVMCRPLPLASVQFSQCRFLKSAVSCNTYPVYVTCVMAKRGKDEVKYFVANGVERIGVQRLELGSHTTPVWYHLAPSAFRGNEPQWTGSVCLCTFAYTLTGTLRKPAGKSPLDYHETVAGLKCGNKTT